MAKQKTIYICTDCGGQSLKWQGQCPSCHSWNTLVESKLETNSKILTKSNISNKVIQLDEIASQEYSRKKTGIRELDRVLGGGLVNGAVILVGGDPGIGKSTLLIQALSSLSKSVKTLYVSGEESSQQISMRAKRLQINSNSLLLLSETKLENILENLNVVNPEIIIIDSIQTIFSEDFMSAPGSVAQVRECSAKLTRFAKTTGACVILVGHVTKEGSIAGPRVLEHMVDAVLYFEGDSQSTFRLIRAIKNRYGSVNEIGVFAMTDKGLKEISNPSAIFLSNLKVDTPGSCVLVTKEGSRPILIEIQALVDTANSTYPKRVSIGLELNRLNMLLAILNKHMSIPVHDQDVFINAVGGVKLNETASDLAVILSVISSFSSKSLPKKLVVFGEVGLGGEIRPVQGGQERLKEAEKLGFEHAIIPKKNMPKYQYKKLKVLSVDRVEDAIKEIRNL